MENLPKPVIVNENGKWKVSYGIGLDANKDGQNSVNCAIVIELDQKEVIEEAIAKILANSNLPQFIKDLIGAK